MLFAGAGLDGGGGFSLCGSLLYGVVFAEKKGIHGVPWYDFGRTGAISGAADDDDRDSGRAVYRGGATATKSPRIFLHENDA